MPFHIIRNDITQVKADIIVNTANPQPVVGSGTDSAVYRAAGEKELLAERKRIGVIEPGNAAVTPAFRLPARYVIHTVGPVWVDGRHGEREILRACYEKPLELAAGLSAGSIAFPLIATGVYGFPRDEALSIALSEIGRFLLTHDMEVILVVFDREAFELSGKLAGEIDAYIDDHGVAQAQDAEYGRIDGREGMGTFRRRRALEERQIVQAPVSCGAPRQEPEDLIPDGAALPMAELAAPAAANMNGRSLDEVLSGAGASFQQRLLELIDQSGMDDVSVYKKANIDRKVFSRIRCHKDYKPKKKTAVAFAIALRLDMPTMLDLLSRAEIAFSPSSKFDLIITYFVSHGNYDIYEINAALFKYGQPILGE